MPYADRHAYKILGQLLKHEYVWNPSTGAYLGGDIDGGEGTGMDTN